MRDDLSYLLLCAATGLDRESYEAKIAHQDYCAQNEPFAAWWASHQGEYV